MTLELENKITGAAIYDFSLFNRYELKPEWMFDKVNRSIIEALGEREEGYADYSELVMDIKSVDPLSPVTEDTIERLSYHYFDVKDYSKGVHLLKRRYLSERIRQANEEYLNQPDKQNLMKLQDRIRALDELEETEDDGSLDSAIQELLYKLENGGEVGLKSYPKIDRVLGSGLRGGTLMTIGARPAVGKTAFALNIAVEIMNKQDEVNIDLFTLEMSKGQMLDRFVSRLSNITSYNLRKPHTRLTEDEKTKVIADALALGQKGLRVYDSMYTIEQIDKQIRRRVHEVGRDNYVAIIDYIGLVETANKRMDRHLQVGEITRTLKKLTNNLNIPIIALSQLNRAVENRNDKKPNLSDLRESGSVEQDSSIVGFLHRDQDDETEVIFSIAKNREGYTTDIRYRFHVASMWFEELN